MVGQNKELVCFKVVAKVADRKVHCEEFTSEGAVPVEGVWKRNQVVAKRC